LIFEVIHISMTGVLRRLLSARPFERFSVVTSSGKQYEVPSPDHAGINPANSRIVIWFDDDSSVTLSALHIAAIEKIASKPGPPGG
jgi:hypothetical protein